MQYHKDVVLPTFSGIRIVIPTETEFKTKKKDLDKDLQLEKFDSHDPNLFMEIYVEINNITENLLLGHDKTPIQTSPLEQNVEGVH